MCSVAAVVVKSTTIFFCSQRNVIRDGYDFLVGRMRSLRLQRTRDLQYGTLD